MRHHQYTLSEIVKYKDQFWVVGEIHYYYNRSHNDVWPDCSLTLYNLTERIHLTDMSAAGHHRNISLPTEEEEITLLLPRMTEPGWNYKNYWNYDKA